MMRRPDPNAVPLPAQPGAYALILDLGRPVRELEIRGARHMLPPGCYLYAGSARGPGGIRARVRRHLRRDKRRHWHIDQLSGRAGQVAAVALPGGSECEIVGALTALGGVEVPVPGFGSSDCRLCAAHLLRLPVADLAAALELCRAAIGRGPVDN